MKNSKCLIQLLEDAADRFADDHGNGDFKIENDAESRQLLSDMKEWNPDVEYRYSKPSEKFIIFDDSQLMRYFVYKFNETKND